MPSKQEVVDALQDARGNASEAARILGCSRGAVLHHRRKLNVAELPDREVPIDTIIQRHINDFARLQEAEQARELIPVTVEEKKPYGILHFGDLHLDNPGSDVRRAFALAEVVRGTDGLYAGEIGDATDNWKGRLCDEYANSRNTRTDGIRLYEAWLKRLDFRNTLLYANEGNHNAWSESGCDPIEWLLRSGMAPYEPGIRLLFQHNNGVNVVLNTRHDFPGHSMHNTAHGPNRAMSRWADHIAICGHKHEAGYNIIQSPVPESGIGMGRISHCIRLGSFKRYDKYAKRKGFSQQGLSPVCVTIIDPNAKDEVGLIGVDFCVERAIRTLKGMR